MREKYITLTITPTSSLLVNDKIEKLKKLQIQSYVVYDRRGRGLLVRVLEKDFDKARGVL